MQGTQLFIRSFELGVLFLPSLEAGYQQHPHRAFTCTPQGLLVGSFAQQHSPGPDRAPALLCEAPAPSASQSTQNPSAGPVVGPSNTNIRAGTERAEPLYSSSAGVWCTIIALTAAPSTSLSPLRLIVGTLKQWSSLAQSGCEFVMKVDINW